MHRHPILLLLSILALPILACSVCDEIPIGPFDRILGCDYSEESDAVLVRKFPQTYVGTAAINTWNVCDTTADAKFTAFEDGTCVLEVAFPTAYQNFEGLMPGDAGYGACKASGDTEGWSIYGSFDKTQQVCKFKYCNDSTAYGAAGNLLFSIIRAEPLSDSITCTYRENGEQKIKVIPGNLIPTTP